MTLPIPPAAPVTMARLPASDMAASFFVTAIAADGGGPRGGEAMHNIR